MGSRSARIRPSLSTITLSTWRWRTSSNLCSIMMMVSDLPYVSCLLPLWQSYRSWSRLARVHQRRISTSSIITCQGSPLLLTSRQIIGEWVKKPSISTISIHPLPFPSFLQWVPYRSPGQRLYLLLPLSQQTGHRSPAKPSLLSWTG